MTVINDAPPPSVGGRYTMGDLIGRGGAADVYRARDQLLGRDVAIKMFVAGGTGELGASRSPGPDGAAPPADVVGDLEVGQDARHRREVLTLAGLSHPGLVTVYDVGDEAGRAYFVMQLIEGDTLAQRIRSGPLDAVDVVALGAALADALAYVHRRGVVHRDVKPGNVLLDGDGRAHLSDFGIAAVRDAAPVTEAGMVIGTASYLSPEQVRGEPVLPAVDVYALGLVLIEALTGRREYPGNALEAAVARLHRRPVVPTGLPAGMTTLLDAMTADAPGDRPAAEDVVGALRTVSRDMGMDARTVLSPVLMTGATQAVAHGPLALGPAAVAAGSGGVADLAPTGAAGVAHPRRISRRSRVVALAGAVAVAVAAAGTAVAYTLTAQPVAPLPAPALPARAPAVVLPAPVTTTSTAEAAESTSAATSTRRRVTTTTPEPVAVAPVAPPPAPVVPPPAAAPPVVTTTDPSPATTTTTTRNRGAAGA